MAYNHNTKFFKFKSAKAAAKYAECSSTNKKFVEWLAGLIKDYDVSKIKFALLPDNSFELFVGASAVCMGQEFSSSIHNLFSSREITEYLDEVESFELDKQEELLSNASNIFAGNLAVAGDSSKVKVVEVSKKITTVLNIQGEFTKSELTDIVVRIKLAMEKL